MVPWSQLYGANFNGAPPGTRTLALTFDYGPNDPYTAQLLEVLDRHGVKATFFLLGQFVSERPELARAVAEAGHAIGSHGYTHRNLIFLSPTQLRQQLEERRGQLNRLRASGLNCFVRRSAGGVRERFPWCVSSAWCRSCGASLAKTGAPHRTKASSTRGFAVSRAEIHPAARRRTPAYGNRSLALCTRHRRDRAALQGRGLRIPYRAANDGSRVGVTFLDLKIRMRHPDRSETEWRDLVSLAWCPRFRATNKLF